MSFDPFKNYIIKKNFLIDLKNLLCSIVRKITMLCTRTLFCNKILCILKQ